MSFHRNIPRPAAALAAATLLACGVPQADDRSAEFRQRADASVNSLLDFYWEPLGRWGVSWWQSANALEVVIDHAAARGGDEHRDLIAHTFDKNHKDDFINDYYDDEGWWALAWLKAYDLTGDARYLDTARALFDDMKTGWDDQCGGGLWWSKERKYKNAITNELFMLVAVRLHLHTPGDGGAGSYLDTAQRTLAWLDQTGLITGDHQIEDGLTDGCRPHVPGYFYTYNQGVILGALVDLSRATGDASLLARAHAIARASLDQRTGADGILRELCEPAGCGNDGPLFKGIFARYLAQLDAAAPDPRYRDFLVKNADSVWSNARSQPLADGTVNYFGLLWSGPFDKADTFRQTAAAALFITLPR